MAKQLIIFALLCSSVCASNFTVTGVSNPAEVSQWADQIASKQSQEWFGKPFPMLNSPIRIDIAQIPGQGSSGVTTGSLESSGRIHDLSISLQGDLQNIADRALPHEIMHVVFLVHYESTLGKQADKWLSEGVATLLENNWLEHKRLLENALRQGRGIPVRWILETDEYHADQNLQYWQSASIVQFLLHHDTFNRLLNFGRDTQLMSMSSALKVHYGYDDINEFAKEWNNWVALGSPSPRARLGNGCVMRFIKRWVSCIKGQPRYPQVTTLTSYSVGGT